MREDVSQGKRKDEAEYVAKILRDVPEVQQCSPLPKFLQYLMDVSVETKNGVKVQDLDRGIIVLWGCEYDSGAGRS